MTPPPNLSAYWRLLKDLSPEEKLSLIELLVQSLRKRKSRVKTTSTQNGKDLISFFAGSWNDFPESAEEMIEVMQRNRTLGREVEIL